MFTNLYGDDEVLDYKSIQNTLNRQKGIGSNLGTDDFNNHMSDKVIKFMDDTIHYDDNSNKNDATATMNNSDNQSDFYTQFNGNTSTNPQQLLQQLTMRNYYNNPGLPLESLPVLSQSAVAGSDAKDPLVDNNALTRLPAYPTKLKKPKQKKPQQGPKSRPGFVMKLWSMVNDSTNEQLIKWLPDGKSFVVSNRESFMKYILPKYFKHNNFASFVRQLNMYGWHKVQDVTHESIHSSGSQLAQETWQFENPNFIKGREDLLENIIRNKSNKEDEEVDFGLLLNELESIKMNQIAIVEDLRRIRSDNQLLWQENFAARERHDKQTQAIDKIMRFLHQVYGNGGNRIEAPSNFNFGDLVQATNSNGQYYPSSGNVGDRQVNKTAQQQDSDIKGDDEYFHKPVLMLTADAHKRSRSDASVTKGDPPSIQEIPRSPRINELDPIAVADTPASTTSSINASGLKSFTKPASQLPNPYVQELINNDPSDFSSIAPSPSSLFPELVTGTANNNADTTTSSTSSTTAALGPHMSSDPQFIDKLEENIAKQSQSIQHVNDWIAKLASQQNTDNGMDYQDLYIPRDDLTTSNGNFNVDEFLAPTPQEYGPGDPFPNGAGDLNRSDTNVGKIDEVVEEPVPKKRKSSSKS